MYWVNWRQMVVFRPRGWSVEELSSINISCALTCRKGPRSEFNDLDSDRTYSKIWTSSTSIIKEQDAKLWNGFRWLRIGSSANIIMNSQLLWKIRKFLANKGTVSLCSYTGTLLQWKSEFRLYVRPFGNRCDNGPRSTGWENRFTALNTFMSLCWRAVGGNHNMKLSIVFRSYYSSGVQCRGNFIRLKVWNLQEDKRSVHRKGWAAGRAFVYVCCYWDFSRINKSEAKLILSERWRSLPDLQVCLCRRMAGHRLNIIPYVFFIWCHSVLLCNNFLLNLVPLSIHHCMFRPLYKAIFRWVFLKLVLVTLVR
jgi:hypothetical protein